MSAAQKGNFGCRFWGGEGAFISMVVGHTLQDRSRNLELKRQNLYRYNRSASQAIQSKWSRSFTSYITQSMQWKLHCTSFFSSITSSFQTQQFQIIQHWLISNTGVKTTQSRLASNTTVEITQCRLASRTTMKAIQYWLDSNIEIAMGPSLRGNIF